MTAHDHPSLSEGWRIELAAQIDADDQWRRAAKYFDGRIRFEWDDGAISWEVRGGRVMSVSPPGPRGDTVIVSGSRTSWDDVIAGQADWFRATSPGVGGLTLTGDVVAAMRNANTFWLLFEAMSDAPRGSRAKCAPASPPPLPGHADVIGRYIEVEGIRTYYEEAGSGPVVLCLHAAAQDTLMYRHVVDALSDTYRVIAFDAPGHGKSALPDGGPFTETVQQAEFTEALIAALGLEKPALLGCSFAGNEVLLLAARRPAHYSAIIAAEGADYTPRFPEFVLDMFESDGHQLLNGWARSLSGLRTPEDRLREVVWQIKRSTTEVMRADLTAYGTFDERTAMHSITAPVLLIRGEDDWLVTDEQVKQTQSRIAGSRIARIPGTGHYPMIESPREFCAIMRDFLHKIVYGVDAS
jgi:pimeloyl-ACP methyl ester carboxylesterase